MAMDDLNEIAERWASRMASSTEKYKKGVMGVKEAPNAKAARMETKYVNNVQQSVADGRYRAGNMRVSLGEWQQVTADKGASRLASGATAGKSKMLRHLQESKPHYDALQAKLATMPNNNLEDAKQRAIVTIEHMAAMKRRM